MVNLVFGLVNLVFGLLNLVFWSQYALTVLKYPFWVIQLLESPIPAAPPAAPSQKASSDDISGTKRGTIDPLVSKRPEKILNEKIKKKT